MKYYLFSGDIEAEALKPVIDFLSRTDDEITLGMDTCGGETCAGYFLLDVINSMTDRLTLVAAGQVYSMGMDIWFKYRGRKRACPEAMGMIHLSFVPGADVNSTGTPDEAVRAYLPTMRRIKKENDKWIKKILTPEEFKKYNKGERIYLDGLRLNEIAAEHNSLL